MLASPSRPDPLVEAEDSGREVEWMSVSSKSRTSVFGRWNGVLRVPDVGVEERVPDCG